jgi:hypothetical protein
MASTSNTEITEHFQSNALLMVVDTPWFVLNMVIRRDLQTKTVTEKISHYSSQYSAHLTALPNNLVENFLVQPDFNRQLQKTHVK